MNGDGIIEYVRPEGRCPNESRTRTGANITHLRRRQRRPVPGCTSPVAGFRHAARYLTGLVAPVAGTVVLVAGQKFSDGGHGGTVDLSERSSIVVSNSVNTF